MDNELKPCPFCGGKSEIDLFMDMWTAECKEKACCARHSYESEEDCIKEWNTRDESQLTALRNELEEANQEIASLQQCDCIQRGAE